MSRILFTLMMAFPLAPTAAAWNDHGHMLISFVAWQRLDQDVREDLVAVLRQHPRFEEDFAARMPSGLDEAEQDLWVFLHASTWPDIARGFDGPTRKVYHHSTWHYVNFPQVLSAADRAWFEDSRPVNLERDWTPDLWPSRMNVLQALHMCRDRLEAPEVSTADKAVLLCWLLHLAGDLHQPMHSTAFFTRQRFPEGDRGGNSIPVTPEGNLHAYWDRVLGRSEELPTLAERAATLLEDEDLAALGAAAAGTLDVVEWARESQALATRTAYSQRLVDVIAAGESDPEAKLPRTALDEEYRERAVRAAQRRVVEAGHRIAVIAENLGL